jgi:hypothetical protein
MERLLRAALVKLPWRPLRVWETKSDTGTVL